MPLSDEQKRERIARRIACELRDGYYVNGHRYADAGGQLCAGGYGSDSAIGEWDARVGP